MSETMRKRLGGTGRKRAGNLAAAAAALLLCAAASLFAAGCDSQAASGGESSLEDGVYEVEVSLEGGSGKASVTSPCTVTVEDGQATALIEWSSPYYDLMTVDGTDYLPVNEDGDSQFEIPIPALDCSLEVEAETTAMSQPHTIEYTLVFGDADDGDGDDADEESGSTTLVTDFRDTDLGCGLQPTESVELEYAQEFSIDRYEGGYTLICTGEGERFLVVPEDAEAPDDLDDDISVIQQPVSEAYIAATSMLCLVDALDAVDAFAFSSISQTDCSVAGFSEAMESGQVAYGGKYSAPDYEALMASGCAFALESTMINHTPKVKRQLESMGITTLTELSSYESDPRGRLEWIKVLGVILDREEQAQAVFDEQLGLIEQVEALEDTGKSVAFFYINSNGQVVVRKSGDYVASMIAMAGGTYVFGDLDDGLATSTTTIDVESFYAQAQDADVLIYNATIDDSVDSIDALIAKNGTLARFAAVQEGSVYVTSEDMYQQMVHTGNIIEDMHAVFSGQDGNLTYLEKLE